MPPLSLGMGGDFGQRRGQSCQILANGRRSRIGRQARQARHPIARLPAGGQSADRGHACREGGALALGRRAAAQAAARRAAPLPPKRRWCPRRRPASRCRRWSTSSSSVTRRRRSAGSAGGLRQPQRPALPRSRRRVRHHAARRRRATWTPITTSPPLLEQPPVRRFETTFVKKRVKATLAVPLAALQVIPAKPGPMNTDRDER